MTPGPSAAASCTFDDSGVRYLEAGTSGFLLVTARDAAGNLVPYGADTFNGTLLLRGRPAPLGLAIHCDAACLVATTTCPCLSLDLGTYGLRVTLNISDVYEAQVRPSLDRLPHPPPSTVPHPSVLFTDRSTPFNPLPHTPPWWG